MLKRYELLAVLQACLDEEERSLPFYTKHDGDPSFLAEFPAPEQVQIRKLLLALKRSTDSHAESFRGVIKMVEGSIQDAF